MKAPYALVTLCTLMMVAQTAKPAHAQFTFFEDFNGTTLNPLLTSSANSGYSYSLSGGQLQLQKSAGLGNGSISIFTTFDLIGDFVAEAKMTRNILRPAGFSGIWAAPASARMYFSEGFMNGTIGSNNQFVGSPSTTSTFRITRAGTTIKLEFQNPTASFLTVNTQTSPSFAGAMNISLFMDQEGGDTRTQSISVDYLSITAQSSTITAPEPTTGLLILGGMLLLIPRRRFRSLVYKQELSTKPQAITQCSPSPFFVRRHSTACSARQRIKTAVTVVSIIVFSLTAKQSYAQYALFDSPIDTIQITGASFFGTTATFEAVVCPFAYQEGVSGILYNEWQNARMDKSLVIRENFVGGYAFTNSTFSALSLNTNISTSSFHHIAFVRDGFFERLYIDGNIALSRNRGNNDDIGDGGSGAGIISRQIGAIFRDGYVNNGFIGYVDSIRISTIARYSSDFSPQLGDMATDQFVNLLYNFNINEVSGGVVTDLSGNGRNGIFGSGFSGATAPSITSTTHAAPEPTTGLLLLTGCLLALAHRYRLG